MDDMAPRAEPTAVPVPPEDMRPQGAPAAHAGPGHELSDVSVRGIFLFAAALAVFSIGLHFSLGAWMADFGRRANRLETRRHARADDQTGQFPTPNLQESPNAEMALMKIEQRDALEGYEWVDRPGGIARIPLERAMQIVAANQGRIPGAAVGDAAAKEATRDAAAQQADPKEATRDAAAKDAAAKPEEPRSQ